MNLDLLLLVAAFLFLLAAAAGVQSRVNLGWLGLAAYVLTAIV